jgi:hypothetical protein
MPRFEVLVRQSALWILVFLLFQSLYPTCYAQASSATLSVNIADSSGAVIPEAALVVRNVETNQEQHIMSGKAGSATFSFLKPGLYFLNVSKDNFAPVSVSNILLNVGDERQLQLILKVGSTSQVVSVDASGHSINTTDASVSTVVDRTFVENTPLNGRSFQSLILLSPGALTTSPQRPSGANTGEFTVNGQRTESNYYMVDGVSANVGTASAPNGAGVSGSLSASTALGTTQALVSVDALQEFRVESSTYSAEYGRNPGGQFSMATRSGSNEWHGTAFDYFRNEALDANSWFNDNTNPITAKPPERQNDFGGTFGGPLRIPRLYDGKDRSFFFFSFEGLHLVQPTAAGINPVPSIALRQSLSGSLQQVLNAFPIPTPNAPDLGGGMSEFIAAWSNPSHATSASIRLDQNVGQRLHLFFRYSGTPSGVSSRGTQVNALSPSDVISSTYLSHTYTGGATAHLAARVDDDFRLNYSSNNLRNLVENDTFGGAIPVDLSQLQGISEGAASEVDLYFGGYYTGINTTNSGGGDQRQWNLVNTLSIERGRHAVKIGVDWRRLAPLIQRASPNIDYEYDYLASVTTNSADEGYSQTYVPVEFPVYINFAAFAQDEWKASTSLSISAGIRWDVNPAPGVSNGLTPYTISGLNDFSTMSLAAQGTPLWKTAWYNIAPRLGAAYILNSNVDHETVIRGGGGVFFDTGQQTGSSGYQGPGFAATNYFGTSYGTANGFPVPADLANPIIFNPPSPPFGVVFVSPPHLQSPYTLQWNVSLEQAVGRSQSFTTSYVGANGRKLLELESSNVAVYNPAFTTLYIYKNGLTSSYNALQLKYQRQVTRGLQALVSYTWSHSLDYGSYNVIYPYQHASSDFDIRHNATAALSYDLPHSASSSQTHALTSGWGADLRFTARSGFPITFNGNSIKNAATDQTYYGGLNTVSGEPLFLYGSRTTYPGGRRINPAAFALPAKGQSGDAPRNFVRGFSAIQSDIALRRTFPIYERLRLQFRAEAFNLLNHPNFGLINSTFGNAQFGEATQILSQSLGTLSPLYQMGGPRSLQLSLKLTW